MNKRIYTASPLCSYKDAQNSNGRREKTRDDSGNRFPAIAFFFYFFSHRNAREKEKKRFRRIIKKRCTATQNPLALFVTK